MQRLLDDLTERDFFEKLVSRDGLHELMNGCLNPTQNIECQTIKSSAATKLQNLQFNVVNLFYIDNTFEKSSSFFARMYQPLFKVEHICNESLCVVTGAW